VQFKTRQTIEASNKTRLYYFPITMEVDIGARREKSLQKVKDAWKSIIERYSNLNENEQGDIVDLLTGRIVTDTGHLRSLKEEKHNIWNQSKDQETEGIIGKEKSPKTIDKYNRRTLPIIGSNRHFQSINTRSQPGDTKYVVSSSQHMTRSKVIGDDNIFVDVLTLGDVKPSLSYDLPGTSDEENDTCKDNSEIMCTRQRRSTLIDQSN